VESEHREHAVVELAIRDLKDQALAHFPSGKFDANSAWCVIAALAHKPRPLDFNDRPARPRAAHRGDPTTQAVPDSRPADPHRRQWTLTPTRPLALAGTVHPKRWSASARSQPRA